MDDDEANTVGRFLALTLNLFVDGADAKSDLSCAVCFSATVGLLDVLVTFLSDAFFSDSLAAADPVGRLILLFSKNLVQRLLKQLRSNLRQQHNES